jgi:predicted permease
MLPRFWRRQRRDQELASELEEYITRETEDGVARGMSTEAARVAARRKLGNVTAVREQVWEVHPMTTIEGIWKDVAYAVRQLRLSPTFTAAAIVSLALGIGANTAVFQLLDAVTLRPLPVPDAQELVQLEVVDPHAGRSGRQTGRNRQVSNPVWERLRDRQEAFSGMFAFGDTRFNLAPRGEVRYVEGLWVSGSFFPGLGVKPALGRFFTPEDDRPRCGYPGAVISHALWQREFGGSPDALNRVIELGPDKVPVIGVARADFFGVEVGRRFDVALPICSANANLPNHFWLAVMGRLKPGWTVERAAAQLATLAPAIHEETTPPSFRPEQASAYRSIRFGAVAASTGVSPLRRSSERPLYLLVGIAALVLLIASANLANLMLARATARENEFGVRIALGGSRGRILRQALVESGMLAVSGAVAGLALARWSGGFLVSMMSTALDPIYLDLSMDWRMLGFTVAVAGGTCLLFGLAPAIRATRAVASIRPGSRGTTASRERFRMRSALVAVQVALSFVLLFGALLFSRSFAKLATTEAGFSRDGVLLAHLFIRGQDHPEASRPAFYARLDDQLASIPGVAAVAAASSPPLSGSFWDTSVRMEGQTRGEANINQVTSGYLAAMGTTLLAGRDFDRRDTPSSTRVAIVSEAFAKKYFAGQSPLGRTFGTPGGAGQPDTTYEVIGLTKDVKYYNLREVFAPLVFLAESQDPNRGTTRRYVIRMAASPSSVIGAIRQVAAQMDPGMAMRFETMQALADQSSLRERMMAALSGFFGVIACVLAVVGLYGVVSYMVARRRGEIGIRIALGAGRGRVVWLVQRHVGVLLSIGLVAGIGIALATARTAESVLYGLTPDDPVTLVGAAGLLAVAGCIAGLVPARRAARIDPAAALREQ